MYIGLDIGGTKTIACGADREGRILQQQQAETPLGLEEGLALIHQMIEEVRCDKPVEGIGASLGGPLDFRTGIVSPLHQPNWRDVPFRQIMEERWACPVTLDVDTNLAALGEFAAMPDKPGRMLYITLSTGMGGGFLVDGSIYRGAGGVHPEIAHQSIPYRCSHPENIRCECGLPDCLEGMISGNAIRRIYGKPAEELDENEWAEVAYNLGQGLRNIAAVLAPDLIVLGGGVAIGRGDKLVTDAGTVMRAHLRLVQAPELRLSRLGYNTALHGAVYATLGIIPFR